MKRAKKMFPIPVSAAGRIADQFGYDQVIIVARRVGKGGGEHCTTYGKDKENCSVAARIGDFFKYKLMGWERDERPFGGCAECLADPEKYEIRPCDHKHVGTAIIEFRDITVDHRIGSIGMPVEVYRDYLGKSVLIAPMHTPIKDIADNDIGYLMRIKSDTMSGRIEIVASLNNTPEIRKALGLPEQQDEALASVQKETIVKHVLPKGKSR